MRFLFISDIHGNYLALKSVLEFSEKLNIDQRYCLGDLTGYFTGINEVVNLFQKYNVKSIVGNHDAFFLGLLPLSETKSYYNSHVKSRAIATESTFKYLNDLPQKISINSNDLSLEFYHGGVNDQLSESVFPNRIKGNEYKAEVNVFGHTHLQFAFKNLNKFFVNPGSIGLPRNGDIRAHFLVFDTDNLAIEEFRIMYNIDRMIEDTLVDDCSDNKFLHNINFGRSSEKILKECDLHLSVFHDIKSLYPEISIINTKFGFVLCKDNFKTFSNLLYLAFYNDDTTILSSSTLVFNWQIENQTRAKLDSFANDLKNDAAGYHYFKVFESKSIFLEHIFNIIKSAFETINEFKLTNVKI